MSIGFLGAFIGGLLTLLSPCSVMLLPAFFSYAFSDVRKLIARTGIFYLGLITTLLPLGVLAGTLGSFVNQHRYTLVTVAAGIVIVLGALMLLNVPLPFLRGGQGSAESTSPVSVYALGTVYGLAGVCAGPLLGAVLTVAAVTGSALYGGLILLLFAAGMALPLLILALVWGRLPFVRRLIRPREVRIGRWRNTWTGIIGGALTIALGVLLIVTSGTSSLGGLLDASTQVEIEGWAYQATSGVPDWLVAAVVVLIAGGAWLFMHRRRVKERRRAASASASG
ncbi:putative integral membrane cytochrome c biogenesis protein [Microbacterium faecale]|uniref:Integral membrane cytochrome c biogenesis protein n=1 Tax=Microbacterium faecale TaxID=1804630 RepID=A0A917DCW6_9MICO|nr:cytochrome c biogenesis CcdA family protein [Microbacterium faecale]GGD29749.1 putative integral membrane cytochrome c biogenesis protein [Microbacterium faecale]